MGEVRKQEGPSIAYPEKPNDPKRFICQNHWRGASVHFDFRFALNDHAEGWTVAQANPGVVEVPIVTLKQAQEAWKDQRIWKVSLKDGHVFPRRIRTTIQGKRRFVLRPGNLFAERKASIVPKEWLDVNGVTAYPPGWPKTVLRWWNKWPSYVKMELRKQGWTPQFARAVLEGKAEWHPPAQVPVGATRSYPGVFHKFEDGLWIPGARKPWFFEYIIEKGKFFNGRLVFRFVRRSKEGGWADLLKGDLAPSGEVVLPPGEGEQTIREPGFWLFMTLDDADEIHPYVVSKDAVDAGWLPPPGVSALPVDFQRALPKELRYWEPSTEDPEAAREKAIDFLGELGWSRTKARKVARSKSINVSKSIPRGEFRLVLQIFRGQFVIRWGPSTAIWWLLLDLPEEKKLIALDNSPILRNAVAGVSEALKGKWDRLWKVTDVEDVKPGTSLNPTKATPSSIQLLDSGTVTVLDSRPGFLKLDFGGKKLRGPWILYEETPGAGIFGFQRAALGPKTKESLRYAYQFHEVPGYPHYDLRLETPAGTLFELSFPEDIRGQPGPFRTQGKACRDRTWLDIDEPRTPRKVQGEWTYVTPLESGQVLNYLEEGDRIKFTLDGALGGTWIYFQPEELLLRSVAEQVKHDLAIVHKSEEQRIVYGIVLSPYGPDAQKDVIPPEEIEAAAHDFLAFGGAIGVNHEGRPIGARPVESFIAPTDFEYVPGDKATLVRKGEWVLAVKVFDDRIWQQVKAGYLTGFSIQGWGKRQPLGSSP